MFKRLFISLSVSLSLALGTYLLIGSFSQLSPAKLKKTTVNKIQDTLILDRESTALSKILAGVAVQDSVYQSLANNPVVKKHYTEFNKAWQSLEDKKLKKMRVWRDKALKGYNANLHNLFYPFSGPDFLNVYELFPNCENYLLFGLEKAGELPKMADLKGNYLNSYLTNIRQGLSEIFQRNYFITSRMSGAFNTNVKGVLPILAVFLAKTDNQIIKIQKVFLEKNGKTTFTSLNYQSKFNLVWGLYIEFKNKNYTNVQKLYYFGTDLADGAMSSKPELSKFIQNFPDKMAFVKSASYLLHTANFDTIRDLILKNTDICVQDDTGVPYKYMVKDWDVRLYGKYDKPIRDFNYGYQPDLMQRFQTDKSIEAIDFTFGYHWWTDKSSIIVAEKKEKKVKE